MSQSQGCWLAASACISHVLEVLEPQSQVEVRTIRAWPEDSMGCAQLWSASGQS